MRFQHLAEQIYCRAWFITPGAHASISHVFERVMVDPKAFDLNPADIFPQRRQLSIDSDGIANIHILGPLGKNLSKVEQSCGATGFEQIRADYGDALKAGAKGILLQFDSPGGTVQGTPELASLIASKPVPTVAYTEDLMASAAYYLAAGADSIVASQSAAVGSIGVYIPWVDSSARMTAAGLKADPIVNAGGDLKAMGFGGKLSEAQRAHLQEQVDNDFAAFKAHVTAYRALPDAAMRGQVETGAKALDLNLIDTIGDMDTARGKLLARIRAN
jgi:signal peptide peptidase SppA